jgi:hypothetical protein
MGIMSELHDVSDPAGALATDAVKRREAWLQGHRGRTYDLVDGWHVLREHGILIARNRDLSLAMDTAARAARGQ